MRRKVRIQRKRREGGRTEERERVGEMVECWKGERRRAKKGKGGEKKKEGRKGIHGRQREREREREREEGERL